MWYDFRNAMAHYQEKFVPSMRAGYMAHFVPTLECGCLYSELVLTSKSYVVPSRTDYLRI